MAVAAVLIVLPCRGRLPTRIRPLRHADDLHVASCPDRLRGQSHFQNVDHAVRLGARASRGNKVYRPVRRGTGRRWVAFVEILPLVGAPATSARLAAAYGQGLEHCRLALPLAVLTSTPSSRLGGSSRWPDRTGFSRLI